MTGFSNTCNRLVELEDGVRARHVRDVEECQGVLIGNGPLQRSDGGFHFQVRVTEVRRPRPEGMAIEVTTVGVALMPGQPPPADL